MRTIPHALAKGEGYIIAENSRGKLQISGTHGGEALWDAMQTGRWRDDIARLTRVHEWSGNGPRFCGLPALEWYMVRPTVSHKAMHLAYRVLPRRGHAFDKAPAEFLGEVRQTTQGMIAVWQAPREDIIRGRVMPQSPGLTNQHHHQPTSQHIRTAIAS